MFSKPKVWKNVLWSNPFKRNICQLFPLSWNNMSDKKSFLGFSDENYYFDHLISVFFSYDIMMRNKSWLFHFIQIKWNNQNLFLFIISYEKNLILNDQNIHFRHWNLRDFFFSLIFFQLKGENWHIFLLKGLDHKTFFKP